MIEPNGHGKVDMPKSEAERQTPFLAKQPAEILKPTLEVVVAKPFILSPDRVVVPLPSCATESKYLFALEEETTNTGFVGDDGDCTVR